MPAADPFSRIPVSDAEYAGTVLELPRERDQRRDTTWAEFRAEIQHLRAACYEVACDLSDEGKDAERAFGRVDGYDDVLRLISHLGADGGKGD